MLTEQWHQQPRSAEAQAGLTQKNRATIMLCRPNDLYDKSPARSPAQVTRLCPQEGSTGKANTCSARKTSSVSARTATKAEKFCCSQLGALRPELLPATADLTRCRHEASGCQGELHLLSPCSGTHLYGLETFRFRALVGELSASGLRIVAVAQPWDHDTGNSQT